ncbi:T9SS type A sorting domain-containing protein, partial [uncultured Fibrobacter sp.]
LMTALISDAKYQSKLDEYWKEAVALGDENYFNQSLKLLNGLLVSGNMPNLMNANSGMTGIAKSKVANAPAVSLQGRTLQVRTDGAARVDVFNVAGHAVKTQAGSQAMDLQGLPAGVYMVRIQAKNATVMQKIRLQ